MERKKKPSFKEADAILTADWHLREDNPTCRTDDFLEAMKKKLQNISQLQKKHNCPILHSGDLFDFWKPSPFLLTFALEHIPDRFYTIYGNHDLPQHNLEMAYKSGIYTLLQAGSIRLLPNTHWNQVPTSESIEIAGKRILVWHTMTWQGVRPWHGCESPRSAGLLRKYKDYDVIVTGHNHKPFTDTHNGRLLVNPGSIFRMNADQQDYKPAVWLWYADENKVVPHYLPIEDGVISREHLESKQERDGRIDAFVTTLNEEWEAEMSFEENLEAFQQANNVPTEVMNAVYSAIE
jgi:putative phosphoesterase